MFLLNFLDYLIYLIPSFITLKVARGVGSLFYYLDKRHRKIAIDNIHKAFPEYSVSQTREIARRAFQHLIVLGAEVLILSRKSPWNWRSRIYDEGLTNLEKARASGKAILFMTGHVGNWELLAYLGKWAGFIDSVIARDPKSERVQKWIQKVRSRYGVNVIGKGQIRYIIEEFKQGHTVGALVDQDGGTRGTFVNFFGRPASTPSGAVKLALKQGLPILPTFIRRVSDRLEFRCYIGNDVTEGLGDLPLAEKEKIALQRYTSALEKFIREDPGQWLWLHRRWKTRPEVEESTYTKRVLLLNDGKPGHFNQLLGVLKGLESWQSHVSRIEFRSRFRRNFIFFMAYFKKGGMGLLRWALTPKSVSELPVWSPSLVLACGSTTASVAFILKKYYGCKSVVIMRSGFRNVEKFFDLAVLPVHDRPPQRGNVVSLQGIPTTITESSIQESALNLQNQLNLGSVRKVGFLVGGPSSRVKMPKSLFAKLISELAKFCGREQHQLLIVTSRRTPPEIENVFDKKISDFQDMRLLLAKNYPHNPIPGVLGLSDIVLVTEDSFSMLMEAVHSGRPVIALRLPKKGFRRIKYEATLRSLEKEGRLFRASVKEVKKTLEHILQHGPFVKKVENLETHNSVQAILKLVHPHS